MNSAINGCPRLSLRSVCGQSAAQSAASLRLSLRQQFLLVFIRNRDVELINIICLNEHSFNKYINYTAAMAFPL